MISIWRKIHLFLALLISIFLVVVSITGIIIAGDIILNKIQNPYKVENFEKLNIAETITNLKKQYPEITEISIDHNQFVELQGISENGDEVKAIINPNNGKILGKPLKESKFIKDVTSLHRSLFLHEAGRFTIGIVALLLSIITFTGIIMIIKRQKSLLRFFSKIHRDFFAQWFHIVAGRWLLVPILITALTGTFLFAKRFKLIPENKAKTTITENKNTENQVKIADFPIFRNTPLSEVKKIEFPFVEDDPEEIFIIKLKNKDLEVNAFSGEVTKETQTPAAELWAAWSLDLHTGQTSAIWAGILALASLGILGFIYTGFAITIRRTKSKIKNTYTAENAEIILLVGSENGTTLGFANDIQKQLLEAGQSVFLAYLNHYQEFKNAKKLLIFTSTYGDGDAPKNAEKFEKLLEKTPQPNQVEFSVIGFGSRAYAHFCGYAEKVYTLLKNQSWAKEITPLHCINDRSPEEFISWAKDFSAQSQIPLSFNEEHYELKIEGLSEFKIIDKSTFDTENEVFSIIMESPNPDFYSGDILTIYPENNHKERQYSIGKIGKNIQLFVKLHSHGLGSQFLYHLNIGDKINAKILENRTFHFPKNVKEVAMIANGTGVAPFLGMMDEKSAKIHLYTGFRYATELTKNFTEIAQHHDLATFRTAYSRGENPQYVMDLVKEDEHLFINLLKNEGAVMLCGSLAMQKNVEETLAEICQKNGLKTIEEYKKEGKILSDCY